MTTPKIGLVVTRHPALVEYLREVDLITNDTPIIEHATPADVRGKHVLGVLPHHLSAIAASITEIPMRWTVADRAAMQAGDVGVDRVRACAGEPVTYTVARIGGGGEDTARPRWLAVAAAWAWVEGAGYHFGAGPDVLTYIDRTFRCLPVMVIWDGGLQVSAEIIPSRGVWRRGHAGPWCDGFGQEVDDDSIVAEPTCE